MEHPHGGHDPVPCRECPLPGEGHPTLGCPSASSVQPGGEFTVELVIHNNPGIAGIRFAFQYDETLLQLTDANGQSVTDWEVGIKSKTGRNRGESRS